MTITAYPLQWPEGWPRTDLSRTAPFKVPPRQAYQELSDELGRLGAKDVIVSTDLPLNRDGTPSLSQRSRYTDHGVAVYFKRKGKDVVLACDQYDQIHDNMRAIGKTIEAMRGIERWGASDMLDRAFAGFVALPSPEQWWSVLGLRPGDGKEAIMAAYRRLAREAHPDMPTGSDAAMSRLNAARDAALASRAA